MRFGTRWRFILPTVMVLCFIGTLGYFEVKERTTRADRIRQQKAHDDKEMVFYIPDESDVVRDGLVILQTIGLIPMLLITDDPFSSNQQWWIYAADVLSVWCIWFIIGLFIDIWKSRASAQAVRIDFDSKSGGSDRHPVPNGKTTSDQ